MENHQRPLLLSSALLLSTIGSSAATLTYLLSATFYSQVLPYIEKYTNLETPGEISRLYVLSLGAISLLSLIGVVNMWKYRKAGYFIYLSAQIALFALPLLVLGKHAFSSTNTIFMLLFITIYSAFLKIFNPKSENG